ncbi:ABC-type Mn2+/Zn2+ transport system permease subunit [Streptomyces olivoverticillatus]|uniref:ABC-type Mn2+/Zn2+ transport system permease subunit n=1 Tax=Streptomyces olivoverticillatus TaxID=66427 RepID=A0A7W7LRW8_9ACTN|nr:hypothetical protein [Streptomyces olivoverticillatus]MBB4894688.1 ABC-type Mn2+/Zn2+ transport system permease subunit [Streptomyces olivoverticillatus]
MPTHSIMPGRHHYAHEGPGPVARGEHLTDVRHAPRAAVAVPVVGGLALGLYTVFLAHDNGYSELQGWLVGLIAAIASGGLGYVLIRRRNSMMAEVRAAAFGALFGASMGFLYSLTGGTVLRASSIGLLFGLGLGVTAYYLFYWREH